MSLVTDLGDPAAAAATGAAAAAALGQAKEQEVLWIEHRRSSEEVRQLRRQEAARKQPTKYKPTISGQAGTPQVAPHVQHVVDLVYASRPGLANVAYKLPRENSKPLVAMWQQ